MTNHYFKTPLKKMGRWSLLPADTECWMTEATSDYHREVFGFGKGILIVCTLDDGYEHPYVPADYFDHIKEFARQERARDLKGLENRLRTFYTLREELMGALADSPKECKSLSDEQLIDHYRTNRDWVHKVTAFDQFGWIGENSWDEDMEHILTRELGIVKDSEEYHRVLFILTKPEEISTTLREKRAVARAAIDIKNGSIEVPVAAKTLAADFGYMPIFAYGEPWDASYYEAELSRTGNRDLQELKREYENLVAYSEIRNKEFNDVVEQYQVTPKQQQVFIDFGLTLDARNEAEYCVSYCGFHMLPMYKEIARRLYLSVRQVRSLYEDEIVSALRGKADPAVLLESKRQIVGYGFDTEMKHRFNIESGEAKKLFDYVESYVEFAQKGEDEKGICGSPGMATGTARILATPDENDRVKEGDILITNATSVDYLPAMKRAAAIVTEVGGLTCHAAVVSREFGIPCVVAYANATTLFTDGQEVEVDAGSGEVRKADV